MLLLEGYLSLPPAVMVGLGVALQTLKLVLSKSFGNRQRPVTQSCVSVPSTTHAWLDPFPPSIVRAKKNLLSRQNESRRFESRRNENIA